VGAAFLLTFSPSRAGDRHVAGARREFWTMPRDDGPFWHFRPLVSAAAADRQQNPMRG